MAQPGQAEVVVGSRTVQPLLRKFRQPLYDEEKIGNGAATQTLQFFARRQGEQDNAAHQKTIRDTNLLSNGELGARQEFYLVGFTATLDWNMKVVDDATAAHGVVTNEIWVTGQIYNDSQFTFQFARSQPLLDLPFDRIPCGVAPVGFIHNNLAATEAAHVLTNGIQTNKEFYDIRLRKNRPRHIQPEQTFTCTISWPNGAITVGTASQHEWYRIMVYMIGILLSAL
jgi:hypothetical protein